MKSTGMSTGVDLTRAYGVTPSIRTSPKTGDLAGKTATSNAEDKLRLILRTDARTHIGRMFQPK